MSFLLLVIGLLKFMMETGFSNFAQFLDIIYTRPKSITIPKQNGRGTRKLDQHACDASAFKATNGRDCVGG